MSLYADYIKERCGKSFLQWEDKGFAIYFQAEVEAEPAMYIEDIYVCPDARQGKVASHMADLIAAEAKALGCTWLLGSVDPTTNGATTSLKVLLGYGFELFEISNGLIMFKKRLEA